MSAPEPDWIECAGGPFLMGGGPSANAQPRHPVTLSPFRLARAPVRRSEYQHFLDATDHAPPDCWQEPAFQGDDLPAVGASWHDADAYCRWLSNELEQPVRLPTEAEWEWAARAGREVIYPWGNTPPEEALPNYGQRWQDGPEPVDAYPSPHPLGFLGLCENVHEWCSDWYSADYYAISPEQDPQGPTEGRRKASRGGAWRHATKVCEVTHRSSIPPQVSYTDYGFRIAAPARP